MELSFLPRVDAPHVYVSAGAVGCFCSHISIYPNLSEGADCVGGQLRGDKECPFSGVIKPGRVWRKVPESGARSVPWPFTLLMTSVTVFLPPFLTIYQSHDLCDGCSCPLPWPSTVLMTSVSVFLPHLCPCPALVVPSVSVSLTPLISPWYDLCGWITAGNRVCIFSCLHSQKFHILGRLVQRRSGGQLFEGTLILLLVRSSIVRLRRSLRGSLDADFGLQKDFHVACLVNAVVSMWSIAGAIVLMLNQNRHHPTPPKWLSSSAGSPSKGSLPAIWRLFLWTCGGRTATCNGFRVQTGERVLEQATQKQHLRRGTAILTAKTKIKRTNQTTTNKQMNNKNDRQANKQTKRDPLPQRTKGRNTHKNCCFGHSQKEVEMQSFEVSFAFINRQIQ